jgi:hypothetical protein
VVVQAVRDTDLLVATNSALVDPEGARSHPREIWALRSEKLFPCILRYALHPYYMVVRTRMLNVRVAELEMTMLQQLAEETGLSVSDVVRQLVRKAHSEAALARAKARRKNI